MSRYPTDPHHVPDWVVALALAVFLVLLIGSAGCGTSKAELRDQAEAGLALAQEAIHEACDVDPPCPCFSENWCLVRRLRVRALEEGRRVDWYLQMASTSARLWLLAEHYGRPWAEAAARMAVDWALAWVQSRWMAESNASGPQP